jgi:RNA polymerase sigma-70 factor (ECF subfamily)
MLDGGVPSMTRPKAAGGQMPSPEPMRAVATTDGSVLDSLLMRIALGDHAAFRSLYDATAGRLFAISIRIVRDRSLAEDVLQEAYVRIWERARRFDPTRGNASAWIIAIVRNHSIDVIRLRGREALPPEGADPDVEDPAVLGGIEAIPDLGAVGRCLALLEDGPRHAIVLAFRDGLSHEELARVLGVPLGTVKSWVSRGLARLRLCLDNRP